jgi:HAD superfamily phosphoserine phosphatase-like hydrolase
VSKQIIVFDFDGTIADTFLQALDIFYKVTGRTEPLPAEEIQRLRGMAMSEAARELQVPFWKMPLLLIRGKKLLASRMDTIHPVEGMPELLRQLKADGHRLYIISSNTKSNIEAFLRRQKLDDVFIEVIGNARLKGKARMLRKLARANQLTDNKLVYVGDETRDIEAAKHAGAMSVAVTWGYNNAQVLERHHPDSLVANADQLTKILTHQQ